MKNEMMETNQTGFLALQDFDLADVMCAETAYLLHLNESRSHLAAV